MKLGFEATSPIGKLYHDIKQKWIDSGRSETDFFKEIDQGCVGNIDLYPTATNQKGVVDQCEVFEIGYRFKDLHSVLAKHGYRLPFGFNDYDPKTTIDAKLQKELQKVAASFKAQVIADGMKEGSKEYRFAVAKKIFGWADKHLDFKQDCRTEFVDWKALAQSCGRCTEIASIVYFLCQEAGLDPTFMLVDNHEPTVKNYNAYSAFSWDLNRPTLETHVFVAIPYPTKDKLFHLDTTGSVKFGHFFSEAKKMTPSQFALMSYRNHMIHSHQNYGEGEPFDHAALERMLDLEPTEVFVPFQKALYELNNYLSSDAVGDISAASIEKVFGHPTLDGAPNHRLAVDILLVVLAFFGQSSAALNQAFKQLHTDLHTLELENSKAATAYSLYAAELVVRISAILAENIAMSQEVKEGLSQLHQMALHFLSPAIRWNPKEMRAHCYINHLNISPKELHEFYSELSEEEPNNQLARYFKIMNGLVHAGNLNEEEAAPVIEEIEGDIAKLKDPNAAHVSFINAQINFFKKNLDAVKVHLDAIKDQEFGSVSAGYHALMFFYCIATENYSLAKETVNKLFDEEPHNGRLFFARFMMHNLREIRLNLGSVGAAGNVGESGQMDLFVWMADRIAEKEDLESQVVVIYSLLYLISLDPSSEHKHQENIYKKISGKMTEEARMAVNYLLFRLSHNMFEKEIKIDDTSVSDAHFYLEESAKILGEREKYPGYIQLCLQAFRTAIEASDAALAKEMIAILAHAEGIATLFYDHVMKQVTEPLFGDDNLTTKEIQRVILFSRAILSEKGAASKELLNLKGFAGVMEGAIEKVDKAFHSKWKQIIIELRK